MASCSLAIDAFEERPVPALTAAQRYHLDVFGYVVVQQTLDRVEAATLLAELKTLRDELVERSSGVFPEDFGATRVRNAYLGGSEDKHSVVNLIEAGGSITGYAAHPRMVAMAEELIGAEARIVESNSIINRRPSDYDPSTQYHMDGIVVLPLAKPVTRTADYFTAAS